MKDRSVIVRVAWPTGREPEEFLERVNRAESAGPYSSGVYEIMASGSSAASKIWFADEMTTGSNPEIVYQACHDSLDDEGDVTTVPDRHLDLLVLFCRWAGVQKSHACGAGERGSGESGSVAIECERAGYERGEGGKKLPEIEGRLPAGREVVAESLLADGQRPNLLMEKIHI